MTLQAIDWKEIEGSSAAFWTGPRLLRATGGQWLAEPQSPIVARGASIDSRLLHPGQIFVAIRGARVDGHDFVGHAARAGAALAVVDRPVPAVGSMPVMLVPDATRGLADLARSWRAMLREVGTRVIAVTGSCGKTTTREMIHAVLSARFRSSRSPRSFNNHLGVPLTLLAAGGKDHSDDFVVVELGTNHPGEIESLAEVVRPECVVITNVGMAHIGHFGSRVAIGREKGSLLRFVEPDGLAVVPGDTELTREGESAVDFLVTETGGRFLQEAVNRVSASVSIQRFGSASDCDPRVVSVDREEGERGAGCCFDLQDGLSISLPLIGRHNIGNALAAIAVGRWAGVKDEYIAEALRTVRGPAMRLEPLTFGHGDRRVTVINDAYNANPDSARAAIVTLADRPLTCPGGRRVLVLGDMLELGDDAKALHRAIGQFIMPFVETTGVIHRVVLIGKLAHCVGDVLDGVVSSGCLHLFEALDEAVPDRVVSLLGGGDVVLLKASRTMELERIVPAVEQRFGAGKDRIPGREASSSVVKELGVLRS